MISEVFTNYQFANKSSLLNVMDALLSPTRLVLGCKTIQYDADNKSFREEDQKCQNIFYRIVLAPIALLLLPVTLVACLIKVVEGSAQKVHQLYQKNFEKSGSVEDNEPFAFTKDQLDTFREHATRGYDREIESFTDLELAVIGDLVKELSELFEGWLQADQTQTQMQSAHFRIERLKPHVFKLKYDDQSGRQYEPIASRRGKIETSPKLAYRIFEGYILSRQDVILGTADTNNDNDEFYIYHKEIINDSFDAEHVTSMAGDGKSFQMTRTRCTFVFFDEQYCQRLRDDARRATATT